MQPTPFYKNKTYILLALLILIILGSGAGLFIFQKNNLALKKNVSDLQTSLEASQKSVDEMTHNNQSLSDALYAEQQKNLALDGQVQTLAAAVEKITGTVATIDKLHTIDHELLIKYSKVYFLNENYTPSALVKIAADYSWNGKEQYFHGRAYPYLENLLKAAKADGAEMKLISTYRSFSTQADLKAEYKVTYGSGANSFSADQGYSEHQLGTTVDFTTPALGASFSTFDKTTAYTWLQDNAYKFGFVLSYPKGNSYYVYEPWHWRFVGVKLATDLHAAGKNFYDMDQRAIDDYLVSIFD